MSSTSPSERPRLVSDTLTRREESDNAAKILQQARTNGGVSRTASQTSKAGLDRKTSSSSYSKSGLDRKVSSGSYAARSPEPAAPPPYSPSSGTSAVGKKAPPPPPPLKPKPGVAPKQYCTAIFDYEAQVRLASRRSVLIVRPKVISLSVPVTGSRSSNVPILPRIGGLDALTVGRGSSLATTRRLIRLLGSAHKLKYSTGNFFYATQTDKTYWIGPSTKVQYIVHLCSRLENPTSLYMSMRPQKFSRTVQV